MIRPVRHQHPEGLHRAHAAGDARRAGRAAAATGSARAGVPRALDRHPEPRAASWRNVDARRRVDRVRRADPGFDADEACASRPDLSVSRFAELEAGDEAPEIRRIDVDPVAGRRGDVDIARERRGAPRGRFRQERAQAIELSFGGARKVRMPARSKRQRDRAAVAHVEIDPRREASLSRSARRRNRTDTAVECPRRIRRCIVTASGVRAATRQRFRRAKPWRGISVPVSESRPCCTSPANGKSSGTPPRTAPVGESERRVLRDGAARRRRRAAARRARRDPASRRPSCRRRSASRCGDPFPNESVRRAPFEHGRSRAPAGWARAAAHSEGSTAACQLPRSAGLLLLRVP